MERKKILIIDDDDNTRIILADVLEEKGYDTVTAVDGAKALEVAATEKPDVVLLDILMPGMGGHEACRRIKDIDGLKTKIIMATGSIEAVDVARAREVGADGFCVKTSDCQNLLEALENVLEE